MYLAVSMKTMWSLDFYTYSEIMKHSSIPSRVVSEKVCREPGLSPPLILNKAVSRDHMEYTKKALLPVLARVISAEV